MYRVKLKKSITAARHSTRSSRRKQSRDITNHMIRCRSSNVWGYAYDIPEGYDTGTLYMQFKNTNGGAGDIYRYYEVPWKVYQKLVVAPSKGHLFHKLIRNNYLYSKLTGDKKGKLKNAVN